MPSMPRLFFHCNNSENAVEAISVQLPLKQARMCYYILVEIERPRISDTIERPFCDPNSNRILKGCLKV